MKFVILETQRGLYENGQSVGRISVQIDMIKQIIPFRDSDECMIHFSPSGHLKVSYKLSQLTDLLNKASEEKVTYEETC